MDNTVSYNKVVVEKFGGTERLRVTTGRIGPPRQGFARVRVAAAGVGYTDVVARRGGYLLQRTTPFTPGYELVGYIVDHHPSEPLPAGLGAGTRVAACLPKMGAYAEYVTVPVRLLVALPDNLDIATAAAMPLDYLTAWSMLHRHAKVSTGDAVLIQGASGGVGQALCQLGQLLGLAMIGTGSASNAEKLRSFGTVPIDYRTEDYATAVHREFPNGVDAIFDHLGGSALRVERKLLKKNGTLVSYAFMGRPGRERRDTLLGGAAVNAQRMLPGPRGAVCRIPHEIKTDPGWYRSALRELFTMAARRDIEPTIGGTFLLADVAAAHIALEQRTAPGKVVLTMPSATSPPAQPAENSSARRAEP
jgi:NADPH:quinone reductase